MLPKWVTAMRALSLMILFIPLLVYSVQSQPPKIKLLLLGDSLSAAYGLQQHQGWVHLLAENWKHHNIEIVNAAISGETSDGGLARLPRLLEQHQPTHLLIELGGNDALQGHSVNKLRKNLAQMIALGKRQSATVLLQEMMIPTNYGRRYQQMFIDSYHLLAKRENIPLVPFFMAEIGLDPELMMPDRIHPNLKAQPKIAAFMEQNLLPLLKPEQAKQNSSEIK